MTGSSTGGSRDSAGGRGSPVAPTCASRDWPRSHTVSRSHVRQRTTCRLDRIRHVARSVSQRLASNMELTEAFLLPTSRAPVDSGRPSAAASSMSMALCDHFCKAVLPKTGNSGVSGARPTVLGRALCLTGN